MRQAAIILLLSLAILPPLAAQAPASPVEAWTDTLRYGIESEVLEVIRKIKDAGDNSFNPELLGLLRATTSPAVITAVLDFFAQGKAGDAEAVVLESLRVAAEAEELDPRRDIPRINYLAAIRSRQAESVLLDLLAAADAGIAGAAIQALGTVGGQAGGEGLLARLRDPEYPASLKPQLIVALGSLKHLPAVEDLLAIAANRDEERVRRLYAAAALGQIGDPRAVPVLRGLFAEEDSLLKTYAAGALAGFDLKEVEPLLQEGLRDANARVRLAAAKALANPGASKSVDILIYKAKNDPDRNVRLQAIQSLAVIGGTRSTALLGELFRDRRQANAYREAALVALCEHDLDAAVPAIRAVVDEEWALKTSSVLEFTARALASVSSPALEGVWRRFLEHASVNIRLYGLRAARQNKLTGLREKIRTLAETDPHPAVRREAQRALAEF